MPMPYTIEQFPGPGGEKRPFKVYPGGSNCPASPEEVQAWEHVKAVEDLNRGLADRVHAQSELLSKRTEAESAPAASPAPAPVQTPDLPRRPRAAGRAGGSERQQPN